MKTRQASVATPIAPATHDTNSSAPPQAAMASSAPTVNNRQIGERRTSIHDQHRNLTAYQRDANTSEVKTIRQDDVTDIQQSPKPDSRWDQFTEAVTAEGDLFLKRLNESDVSELAAWLRTSPSALRSLNIYECDIDAGAAALADALQINTTLTTLHLNGNNIGAKGAVALAEALLGNTTLTTLDLYLNSIGSEGAVALSEALLGNTTLRTLLLGRNDIGAECAVALAKALLGNAALMTIDLSFNDIGAEGAAALAELLRANKKLTELDVSFNSIDAEDAVALANALKFNTNLRTLRLGGCVLDTYAAAKLVDVLKVNKTLTNLYLSLFYLDIDSTVQDEIINLLERNRDLRLQPYAKASVDLLVRHSPVLKDMDFPTDVIPVLAQQLSTEVLSVFEQEWRDAFRAPPPPVITTTTNATITTTTTTTTDSTIPTTLITSPAATATSPASVPPVSTQPTATAAEIKALLDNPNPVVALSRWIDGHANPAAALNWVDPANGYTLLHYAVAAQEGGVVRSLLARGIDPTRADQNNQTAAQLAQRLADSSSSSAVVAIAALFK